MAVGIDTPLVAIVGETASGKTAAGIQVAQKLGGEIICADSRTVYKHMDIGTAKPTLVEQKLVPHHLIDVVEPNERFSAAEFKRLAEKCIQDITTRHKIPIIVGGTGLYVDSLLYNFQFKDKPSEQFRQKLLQMNSEELTTLLNTKNIDQSALNTKNRRHVIRAIETNGQRLHNTKLRRNTLIVGLKLEREVLQERVEKRVAKMFEEGFIDEVKNLAKFYGWENESMSGIGYRVVKDYLEGRATLEEAQAAFVRRDLSLAKRQRTWFKRNKNIHWFEESSELIDFAVTFIQDQISGVQ